ncbi:hypothetical protein Ac2012v2_002679 [Leucoagaricus gongylophorus]
MVSSAQQTTLFFPPFPMIPRFVNPHALFEKTKIISRVALCTEEGGERCLKPDLSLLDKFNAIVEDTLPLANLEGRPKRCGELEVEEKREEEKRDTDEFILFRLISSGPPVLVSLKPKQETFIKVKEPEIEDNETQARERRERALAVAVDADWIVQESLKPCRHPFDPSPTLHLNLSVPLAPLMILSHNKHVRNTRPPIQSKLNYPYDASAKPEPLESAKGRNEDAEGKTSGR